MKKAFTLIEIMIALMILSILVLAMSGVIKGLKSTKKVLDNYYFTTKDNELLVKVLYGDILNADSIKIVHSKNSDYDRIYLTSSNSLYHLINPNILWYVSRNKNTLIRIESPFKINLPNENLFFLDKFKSNINLFKIYRKKGKDLIVIKGDKPLYFEIIDKDLGIKSIQKNGTNINQKKNIKSDNSNNSNIEQPSALPTF